MDHPREQIDPALLRISGEVDSDLRTGRRRGRDENVLRRFEIGKTVIRRVHRKLDHRGRAATEIGGDVARQVTLLGKDRDRLSGREVGREVIELRDLPLIGEQSGAGGSAASRLVMRRLSRPNTPTMISASSAGTWMKPS